MPMSITQGHGKISAESQQTTARGRGAVRLMKQRGTSPLKWKKWPNVAKSAKVA